MTYPAPPACSSGSQRWHFHSWPECCRRSCSPYLPCRTHHECIPWLASVHSHHGCLWKYKLTTNHYKDSYCTWRLIYKVSSTDIDLKKVWEVWEAYFLLNYLKRYTVICQPSNDKTRPTSQFKSLLYINSMPSNFFMETNPTSQRDTWRCV